jgi:hypothetical protein
VFLQGETCPNKAQIKGGVTEIDWRRHDLKGGLVSVSTTALDTSLTWRRCGPLVIVIQDGE